MPSKVTLINGSFEDAEGNLLANGYLVMRLSQDGAISGVGQICSGIDITITLDSSGNVNTGQAVWGNDQMIPANSFYRVTGYKANGQLAWGANNQQVNGSGGTFDVGTWVPNTVLSWTPSLQSLILQTNEVLNGSQTLLDLKAGSNVTLTDNGLGRITIASSTASVPIATRQRWWRIINSAINGVSTAEESVGKAIPVALSNASLTINPTATEPFYHQVSTSASAGSQRAGWDCEQAATTTNGRIITLASLLSWQARVQLVETTTERVWLGIGVWSNAGNGPTDVGVMDTDIPNLKYVGFRYSTNAGDTTWKLITQTDNTHQTVTALTGAPLDTNGHVFKLTFDGTAVHALIDAVDYGSSSVNVPSTSQLMSACVVIDNVSGSVIRHLNQSYNIIELNLG